jgi:hypothetical protein
MSTNINILSSGIETRFAKYTNTGTYPNSYLCGTAKLNTPEGTNAWTIKMVQVNANGNVTILNPPSNGSVNWTARETYSYT